MARLWHTGFEMNSTAADDAEWDTTTDTSAILSISSTIKRSGDYSLRAFRTGSNAAGHINTRVAANSTTMDMYVRFWVYVASAPTQDLKTIFRARNVGSLTTSAEIKLNSNLTLELWDGATPAQRGSDSPALSLNTWHCIHVQVVGSTATAFLDGTQFATGSTTSNPTQVYFGVIQSAIIDIHFDDIAVNDGSGTESNGLPSIDVFTIRLKPAGAGDNNPTAGTWADIDETQPNDATDYIQLDTDGAIGDFTLEDPVAAGIPSGSTINLISVGIKHRAETAAAMSFVTRIKGSSGGTVVESATTSHNDTTWRVNGDGVPRVPGPIVYVHPDDSSVIDTTSLADFQIGVRAVDATPDIWVTTLWAYVEYIPLTATVVTVTHSTDAFKRRELTVTHTTDALLSIAGLNVVTVPHTTDASKKIVPTLSHTTDTYLAGGLGIMREGSATIGGNNTATFSHTVTTTNHSILIVVVGHDAYTKSSTGVTYAGEAMTLYDLQASTSGAGGNNCAVEIYYLLDPPTGANNVVIDSPTTGYRGVAVTYEGVDQTTPIEATNAGQNASLAVTTLSSGAMVVNALVRGEETAMTPGSGETELADVQFPGGAGTNETRLYVGEEGPVVTPASITMNPSGGSGNAAHILIALKKYTPAAASYLITHSTDAYKLKTFTVTHTSDALKKNIYTASHTSDALKRIVAILTHTTDAFRKKSFNLTHTTDSLKLKVFTATHLTDALKNKAYTITHTTDSLRRISSTLSHTSDSYLKKAYTQSHLTDANKRAVYTASHTTDSLKLRVYTQSHLTDALKRIASVLTHSTDALRNKQFTATHTTDSLRRKAIEVSHTTSANKRAAYTSSHTSDALIRKINTIAHTTDASKLISFLASHTTDSLLRQVTTGSHTTDSLLRIAVYLTHATDALKSGPVAISHDTDAFKRIASVLNHSTDAVLHYLATQSHDTDALKRIENILAHTSDALIRKGNTAFHTTDSIKRGEYIRFHTTDALIRQSTGLIHQTDALLRKVGTADHTTDAYRRISTQLSHLTDALKRAAFTGFHTTDSLKTSSTQVSHTTDSLLKVSPILSHSTDTELRRTRVVHTTDALKGVKVDYDLNIILVDGSPALKVAQGYYIEL